ncbi:MAG: hypothetical protein WC494_03845 [Candidatus Pacearchaeota archaeon]
MIRAIMIVEIAGHPPEHISETLKKHVGALNSFKDIKVNSIQMSEPKEIEGQKGIYTCFAEVDFETENLARLSDTMFDFMPSSIEILEPSKVSFTGQEASSLLNNISGRMHRYDEVARVAIERMRVAEEQLVKQKEGKTEKPAKVKKARKKKSKA